MTAGAIGKSSTSAASTRTCRPIWSKPAAARGQVSYALNVQLNHDAPVGYLNEQIVLVTNDPQSPQIPLKVEGHVESAVTVSPASLFLGVVEPGKRVTKQMVSRARSPSASCRSPATTARSSSARKATRCAKTMHMIPVTFVAGGSSGKIQRTIHITTDQGDDVPDLAAFAVVTKP